MQIIKTVSWRGMYLVEFASGKTIDLATAAITPHGWLIASDKFGVLKNDGRLGKAIIAAVEEFRKKQEENKNGR